jgi:hypothetical protein
MGLWKMLASLLGGQDSSGYWVYVRCGRCGEAIGTRINLANDLSRQEDGTYFVSKTLVGNQLCFERIEVNLKFDEKRQLAEKQIQGGDFITREEYEAAQSN